MTRDIVIVVFIGVSCGPDTGVTAPYEVFIAYQIILTGEERKDKVTLFDLIIIELLEIPTHGHWSDGISRIEAIKLVTGSKHRQHVASCEPISSSS